MHVKNVDSPMSRGSALFSGGRAMRDLFQSTVFQHLAAKTGKNSGLKKGSSSCTLVPPQGSVKSLNSKPIEGKVLHHISSFQNIFSALL